MVAIANHIQDLSCGIEVTIWQVMHNTNIIGQALSFKAIAGDGGEVISMNYIANWQFSQTFEGSNF
jgi:hypothetical protein